MLQSLRGLYVFTYVAESLSFSRAAEQLGITKSAVSKQIAQLEAELSVQLIVRTTRKLVLTEAGERVYASSARIAGDVEQAREAARVESSVIAGQLRLTAPTALGRNYLVPVIAEFMARHPEVGFELVLSDAYIDLVQARVDLALRVGGSSEQSLVIRKLSRVEFFIVAAPSYLAKHGAPRTPPDLARHIWLEHTPSGAGARVTVRKGQREASVELHGRWSCNDGPTNLEAARQGLGMLAGPDFEVAPYVHNGELVRVLPAWKVDDASMHLVFPPRRHVLRRVRAFADFLGEKFADPPWRCRG
jgi:DNA-binding transcriptional LysR family regulator